ncbi:MAG: hypothetical protein ACE14T_03240 [Syntrophales bacterium]
MPLRKYCVWKMVLVLLLIVVIPFTVCAADRKVLLTIPDCGT